MHRRKHNNDYGETWTIASTLLNGPCNKEAIQKKFVNSLRKYGFMLPDLNRKYNDSELSDWLGRILNQMIDMKWITEKDEIYILTEKGKNEAKKFNDEIKKSCDMINNLLTAKRASIVTMVVHFVLALIKLPAAILSGSVGLLNDAIDTTADAVSSLIVYLGIRYNKERTVNIILVLFMIITGGFTLFQAVKKIFVPEQLDIDVIAFTVAIISALICLLLYFYQRYVGSKTSTTALITQSVDSRNHVIAALGVTGGLIAALFHIVWIDIIVGLIMALLICKSAIELLIDLIKNSGKEEIDFSKYKFGAYHKFIINRYFNWMLYYIEKNEIENKAILLERAKEELFGEGISAIEFFDIENKSNSLWLLEKTVNDLFDKEMVEESKILYITDKGKKYLEKTKTRQEKMKKENTSMMHQFIVIIYSILGIIVFNLWYFVLKYIFSRFGIFPLFSESVNNIIYIREFNFSIIYYLIGFITYIYGWIKLWQISHYNKKARDKEVRKPRKLIIDKYYANVRHPMYGKMIFIQIGIFTALNISIAYILCIVLIGIHILNGLYEDKVQLPKYFPKEFDDYKKIVRKMFFSNIEIISIIFLITLNFVAIVM